MDTEGLLRYLTAQAPFKEQVVHVEHIPPRDPIPGALAKPLSQILEDRLQRQRVWPLYSHQAEAVNHARAGENVIVSTSSASGKTLCYNVPVAEAVVPRKRACALYLFPTKALAQDQLHTLKDMLCPDLLNVDEVATFDGDTPLDERAAIRNHARIILTNPDMLHVGILPNHQNWSRLLRNLKYVVVDEAHAYRGVFGSHVAIVLRRLRRLCQFYGAEPQFILCSATIANPGEHATGLTGLPFTVVDRDGSPYGGKDFVFWNPPLVDKSKSARRSANSEASALFAELVGHGVRTLTFARTRRLTELIYNFTRKHLDEYEPPLSTKIKPYRAGYLAKDRRQIEKELFGGQLLGVVATNALELGIDIGDLDATILTGYPGSIASTWQQAGRSGRRQERSLSFLIGLDGPLDQYLMNHPDFFFHHGFEHALVNPANHYILSGHLLCAAWELPLSAPDEKFFGATMLPEIAALEKLEMLRQRRAWWYLTPQVNYPSQDVNIRAASSENYALIDTSTNSLLETIEASVAFFQIFEGAIYLHQGESYLITKLDIPGHTATAQPTDATYYTVTKELTDLHILNTLQKKNIGNVEVCLGEVEVTTAVVGFKKKQQFTEEIIGEQALELPPYKFQTVAFWFDIPQEITAQIAKEDLDFAGGLHATEHAAIGLLPLFALCDRNDIGGVSTPFHADTGKAEIFIYDAYPGGIGIAEKGFELLPQLWQATLQAVTDCPCQDGCPSCVQSPKCGNNNQPLDKQAAKVMLSGLLGTPSSKQTPPTLSF